MISSDETFIILFSHGSTTKSPDSHKADQDGDSQARVYVPINRGGGKVLRQNRNGHWPLRNMQWPAHNQKRAVGEELRAGVLVLS